MQGVALLGWTLGFLRPYRWRAAAIVALALTEVGLATLAPWPLKGLGDSVLGETPLSSGLTALLPGTMISSATALLVAVVVAGHTSAPHTSGIWFGGAGVAYETADGLLLD